MSLRVWLPLNGNYDNLGIGSTTTTNANSGTFVTPGKLAASAYSAGRLHVTYDYASTNRMSVAMWVKPLSTAPAWSSVFGWGHSDLANRIEVTAAGGNGYTFFGKSNCLIASSTAITASSFTVDTWHHFVMVADGSKVRFYLDGAMIKEATQKNTVAESFGSLNKLYFGGYDDYFKGYYNDVRVYDHALSAREVHELSQGLVVHYPMCSAYGSGRANFYSGETARGMSSSVSGFTRAKLENEDGYRYSMNYTGTGSQVWASISFPGVSNAKLTAGKKYVWSCSYRVIECTADSLSMRNAIYSNDYTHGQTTIMNSSSATGVWKTCTRTLTLTEGMTIGSGTSQYYYYITESAYNADTTHTNKRYMSPRVEFYTGDRKTSGTVYKMTIDIKDVQLIEADVFPGWTDGAMSSSIVRDCSGHGYDGTVSSVPPTMVSGSPRNSLAWKYNDNTYIWLSDPISASATEFTISMWIRPDNVSGNKCLWNGRTTVGAAVAVFLIGNTIRFDDSNQTTYSASLVANTWYHIACSWKSGGNKIIYVNGEQKSSVTAGTLSKTNTKASIGASSSADSTPASNLITSSLSDFRVYMTQLSAADVKALYNAPIRVTKTGSLHSDGELTEGYASSEFRKTGDVRCSGVSEIIAHFDNTVYFEPDGSTWIRVVHHADPTTYKFASTDAFATHVYKDTRRWFCGEIMNWVDKWEFMVVQKADGSASTYKYRWLQTANPNTAAFADVAASTITKNTGTGYTTFSTGGVYKFNSSTYYCTNNGSANNWWGAIGAWNAHQGGIPGWAGTVVKDGGFIDLYLRVDNVAWTGTVPGKLSVDKETRGIVTSLIVEN